VIVGRHGPVYTNEWIRRVVERNGTSSTNFDVASNPSSCAKALRYRLSSSDRIVVGADSEPAANISKAIYAPLTRVRTTAATTPSSVIAQSPIRHAADDIDKAAELIKHASNAFLR